MNNNPAKKPSPATYTRRGWFRAAVRWSALGGLGALSTWLLLRSGDGSCPTPGVSCHGCGRLAQCKLPQAVEIKRTISR